MINSIPLELVYDIFSRLPPKSIGRCRCVSKQWRSILCSADFTDYFLTKSSTRPSLLFAMNRYSSNEFLFFSSPPQIQSKSSTSLAAAPYYKLNLQLGFRGRAAGLLCFRYFIRNGGDETMHLVICNPCIGQYVVLPTTTSSNSYLGFDPVDKVFKVLSPNYAYSSSFAYIMTLGTGESRWRKKRFPLAHSPLSEGICINGSLYYLARENYSALFIVCFDVRSENFKLIQGSFDLDSYRRLRLINYRGKLGVISWPKEIWDSIEGDYSRSKEEVRIWVPEDDQDWSEYAYTLPGDKFRDVECDVFEVNVAGVTATGEIVLMNPNYNPSEPFYVFYFHPEMNLIKRVEVQGLGNHHGTVDAFVDHVDDLRTFDMESWQTDFLKFESIDKFNALCLLENS